MYLSSLICGQKGKSNGKAPIWFSNHDVIVKLVLLMVKLASYQTESWHFLTFSFLESIIRNEFLCMENQCEHLIYMGELMMT